MLIALFTMTMFACGKGESGGQNTTETNSVGDSNKKEWWTIDVYNVETSEDEPFLIRLLDVTVDETAIKDAISWYVENDGYYDVSAPPENLKWVMITTEGMWPAGTQASEYGSPSPRVQITNKEKLKGGVIEFKGITWFISTIQLYRPDPHPANEIRTYKWLSAIPEEMLLDDVVIQFGWSENILVNLSGETFEYNPYE